MSPPADRHNPRGGIRGERISLLAWLGLLGVAALRRRRRSALLGEPDLAVPPAVALSRSRRQLSWSGVLAGAAIILAAMLLGTLAGFGLVLAGLVSLELIRDSPWVLATAAAGPIMLAFAVGGWMAAYIARPTRRLDGALHGLAVWAVVGLVAAGVAMAALAWTGAGATTVGVRTAAIVERLAADLARLAPLVVEQEEPGLLPVPAADLGSEARDLVQQGLNRPAETLAKAEAALAAAERVLTETPPTASTAVRPGMPGPPLTDAEAVAVIAQQTGVPAERAIEGLAEWRPVPASSLYDRLAVAVWVEIDELREWLAIVLLLSAAIAALAAVAATVGGAAAGAWSSPDSSRRE